MAGAGTKDLLTTSTPSAWTTPAKEGKSIPDMTFKTRTRRPKKSTEDTNPFDWKDVTTASLFKGKRSVIFSLPGAFTPTCSSTHVPGYEAKYAELKAQGIDEVYCLAVNDAFVMRQWGLSLGLPEDKTEGSLGFKNVKLVPDGSALFTRGMGLSCAWVENRGFGERSWRYSAVIGPDMKVEKIFIEPGYGQDHEFDPFGVSDAGTMLNYLKSTKK